MKYKLLSVSKFPNISGVNIGDYVQALASAQFLPHVDGFIDRDEELKDYDDEPCKVIMNGWYMHLPQNWPPSSLIDPLFVAFHLNSGVQKELLSPESISYLKKHQPIGCRDLNTMELLKSNGVEAYFSGCMTLTLGEKYHSAEKDGKTYIVDPIYNGHLGMKHIFKAICIMLRHPFDILKLFTTKQLHLHNGRNFIKEAIKTALFYKEYSRVFGRELVMNSTYVNQESMYYKVHFNTDADRLAEAERLVEMYAKARLVITSRIHCALPCLGLGTPVIYLEKGNDIEESKCRLGGLSDLFNIVKIENGTLIPQFDTALPITASNHPTNKDTWRNLAIELKHRCREFVTTTTISP